MNEKKPEHSYASLKGLHRAVPILLVALAIFTGLCFILQDVGIFGKATGGVMLGLFSYGAYSVPILLLIHALFYPSDIGKKRILTRTIFSVLTVIFIAALSYTIANWGDKDAAFSVSQFYIDGQNHIGGGFIGGVIGFAITKLIGSVGMVILAAVIFALYITYFFSGGNNVFITVLKGIIKVCAFIERNVKNLFEKGKAARAKKKLIRSQKNNEKLTEDEFFAADNGMQSLSINELGINESRSAESIEQNPTLQEKVHHKNRDDSPKEDIVDDGDYMFFTPEEEHTRAETTVKKIFTDIEFEDSYTEPTAFRKDIFSDVQEDTAPVFSDGDSAESVFTSGFDPFDFAKADMLVNKLSSKADEKTAPSTGYCHVTEEIPEVRADEDERARKLAEFELRREQLKEMKIAEEAAKAKENTPKTVEFTVTSNNVSHDIREDEASVSAVIDKNNAEQTAYRNPYKNDFTVNTNRAEQVGARGDQSSGAESTYKRAAEFASAITNQAPSSVSDHDLRDERIGYGASEPAVNAASAGLGGAAFGAAAAGAQNSFSNPKFVDYATPVAETSKFIFEVDEPDNEKETLTVERSRVAPTEIPAYDEPSDDEDTNSFTSSGSVNISFEAEDADKTPYFDPHDSFDDEDESDDDLSDYRGEEDFDIGEEIPPEEQSEAVKGYRDMFAVFRDEEDSEPDEDFEQEAVVPENDNEPLPRDGYTPEETDCADEDEYIPVEDVPPFDAPSTVSAVPSAISDIVVKTPEPEPKKKKNNYKNYKTPPLDLLGLDEAQDDEQMLAEIKENTSILIETLQSFNVTASIKGVDKGPRITRYEVVPAKGVKVNAITHLFQDIELNLAAEGIRMEAPIPGKSAIGFEIPNKHPANVRLRELLETEEFQNAKSVTFVCIGKDVAGNPIFGDVAKYPHALVAGATGMGKSVCINSIMISMLYKARPEEVKFIMIDPKKVEFKMYSGIPHLLIPVITEAKQAAGALMWAVEEMERRYDLIEENYVRNIDAYNEKVKANPSIGDPLPKIIIVIDELNDLMMQVRDPVEDLIMRIAQKARAAGIHLIIGTQRPSVNVITGTIKANINTRISCKVSSQVDSRTILEMAGAEKLLNRGDMLYMPVDRPKPIRVQGAFVSDPEVEAIMDFLKSQSDGAQYDDEVFAEINRAAQKCNKKSGGGGSDDDGGDDDQVGYYNDQQFLDGVELAIRSGKISTALLQRKLSIGYGKAARYIDAMVEIGIVSEPNGSKPRDVLITMDEWHEKLSRVNLDN